MKKIFLCFYAVVVSLMATSCVVTDDGDFKLTWVFWVLLGAFIFAGILGAKEKEKTKAEMERRGIKISDFVKMGHIIAGHPDVDKGIENSLAKIENGNIKFYKVDNYSLFDSEAEIPKSAYVSIPIDTIEDITVEDKTSIEHKITVGRIFLVGIFALGWKKKKVNEQAFVVIKWKTGKFVNETIFMFENKGALQLANTARNFLVKNCS